MRSKTFSRFLGVFLAVTFAAMAGRGALGQDLHPTDNDLSAGTPVLHPTDNDLSAGTPVLHPTDDDLSAGTPVLKSFEQKITTKVLPNGLTLLVCERPDAPVFSYTTYVDAGDVNDPTGDSGLAHMFEHLAFKGTTQIGTTDYAKEKVALEKVEAANNAYQAESLKPVGRDPQKLAALHKAFVEAQTEAEKFVIPNQFTEVAERNGATRIECVDGPGRDRVLLVDAGEPDGTVGVAGERPASRCGAARVLQRTRCGDGRAAHAHRLQPHWAAGGAVSGDRLCGAQLWPQQHWMAERSGSDYGDRGDGVPPEVLRGIEHRGGGGGRREGNRSAANAGEVFQQGAGRAEAGGHDDGGAEAVCGEVSDDSRADAAVLH